MIIFKRITYKNFKSVGNSPITIDFIGNNSTLITGKNGCGKSSLLKIIAGISKATSGRILFNEEDIENIRGDFNSILQ